MTDDRKDRTTLRCDICGEPATTLFQEAIELLPRDGMRVFAPGTLEARCDKHPPEKDDDEL